MSPSTECWVEVLASFKDTNNDEQLTDQISDVISSTTHIEHMKRLLRMIKSAVEKSMSYILRSAVEASQPRYPSFRSGPSRYPLVEPSNNLVSLRKLSTFVSQQTYFIPSALYSACVIRLAPCATTSQEGLPIHPYAISCPSDGDLRLIREKSMQVFLLQDPADLPC